jgi:hypothetical protein
VKKESYLIMKAFYVVFYFKFKLHTQWIKLLVFIYNVLQENTEERTKRKEEQQRDRNSLWDNCFVLGCLRNSENMI